MTEITQIEGQILSAPLVFEELAFFCGLKSDNTMRVFAVDLLSAVVVWDLELAGFPPCYWSCGVIAGESLVTFDAGRILRVDLRTGRLLAERDLGTDFHVTSPAVASEGTIYVATIRGELMALASDLSTKWVVAGEAQAGISNRVIYSPPAIVDQIIVYQTCGGWQGEVIAVNARTGKEIWRSSGRDGRGVPTVNDRFAFVHFVRKSQGVEPLSELQALQLSTGERRWSVPIPGYPVDDPPLEGGCVLAGRRLYHCFRPGFLEARSWEDGQLLWERPLTADCRNAPVADSSCVFVVTETGSVGAFERETGSRQWSFELHDQLSSTPAVSSHGIVITSRQGKLWIIKNE
ncbi:MAG: PQQ-binding-like beta-propeller repeat protein [Actinomycetia bacterium]|nr:PQQ-binding-like beta-propeller repeat protein [Actinomycetes bacterium]